MKNSSKGGAGTWILVIIALIIIAGGIYLYSQKAPAPSAPTSAWETYTNAAYGFTFQYPSDWAISQNAAGTSVTITSDTAADDTTTIDFSVIQDNAFGEIESKWGDIKYNATDAALVDAGETPARCLTESSLAQNSATTSLPSFPYNGSMMSTPAYEESAILTNKDYMLNVSESSYEYNPIEDQIYSSLAFIGGVQARVPACATSSQ